MAGATGLCQNCNEEFDYASGECPNCGWDSKSWRAGGRYGASRRGIGYPPGE